MARGKNPHPKPEPFLATDTEEVRRVKAERAFAWGRYRLSQDLGEKHAVEPSRLISLFDRMDRVPWPGLGGGIVDRYRPFLRALEVVTPEQACTIFEHVDLLQLYRRARAFLELGNPLVPLYSLNDLTDLTRSFVEFLQKNREGLLRSGHPGEYFAASPWLDALLARLYYDRIPQLIELEGGRYVGRWPCRWTEHGVPQPFRRWLGYEGRVSIPLRYVWQVPAGYGPLPRTGLIREPKSITTERYDAVPTMPGLDSEDARKMQQFRSMVLDAKIAVMTGVLPILEKRIRSDLIRETFSAMRSHGLNAREVEFLFKMDRKLTHFDIRTGEEGNWEIRGLPGGITDLLVFMFHCEEEMRRGTHDRCYESLKTLSAKRNSDDWRFTPRDYFATLNDPGRDMIDSALDQYWAWTEGRALNIDELARRTCMEIGRKPPGPPQKRKNDGARTAGQRLDPPPEGPSGDRRLELTVEAGRVLLNQCVVVHKQGHVSYAIMRLLSESFQRCRFDAKPGDDDPIVTQRILIRQLADRTGRDSITPQYLARYVNRLKSKIRLVARENLGIQLEPDDVIETRRWQGVGEEKPGYRLNPRNVVVRQGDLSHPS